MRCRAARPKKRPRKLALHSRFLPGLRVQQPHLRRLKMMGVGEELAQVVFGVAAIGALPLGIENDGAVRGVLKQNVGARRWMVRSR